MNEEFDRVSNPDHPDYDIEWYLKYDVPNTDDWYNLVETLVDAKELARSLIRKKEISILDRITISQANSKKASDKVIIAGDELLLTIDALEPYFQKKFIDAEMVSLWGALNKSYTILKTFYPELVSRRQKGEKGKAATNREAQKQWYALWWKNRGSMTRVALNKYLYNLCKAVVAEIVKPPKGWSEPDFRNFVVLMLPEGNTQSLAETYGPTNLTKKKLLKLLESAESNPNLPPVGFEEYEGYNPQV